MPLYVQVVDIRGTFKAFPRMGAIFIGFLRIRHAGEVGPGKLKSNYKSDKCSNAGLRHQLARTVIFPSSRRLVRMSLSLALYMPCAQNRLLPRLPNLVQPLFRLGDELFQYSFYTSVQSKAHNGAQPDDAASEPLLLAFDFLARHEA